MAANPEPKLCEPSEIIGTLQSILARSQLIIQNLETPYSRFPNTDHSAIEFKDQSISTIITERQQQLDAVLNDISGLEIVMDKLKGIGHHLVEKRDKIIRSMNLHRGLISALWRLPTEALSHIFVHCLPEIKLLQPEMKLAPILLTRICRRWREVAVGMSSLWCRVSMESNWQQAAFCYKSWLERSRGCTLSLTLRCSLRDIADLRSFLQPYFNQTSSLHLMDPALYHLRPPPLQPLLQDFPALQGLTIPAHCFSEPDVTQSILRMTATLRSLRLIGWWVVNVEGLSSFRSGWAHLTNVEITWFDHRRLPQLLKLATNLSSLMVGMIPQRIIPPVEPCTHTKLQSLRIANVNRPDLCYYDFSDTFNALSLPNLRLLEACFGSVKWPHEQFMEFLARSNPPLERLIFCVEGMTTCEQRAEYITIIPSLEVVLDPQRPRFLDDV